MAFFAGKSGLIKIGVLGAEVTKKLTDWSMDVKTESLDVTNFTSSGWQEVISGIFSIEVSASGPYDGTSSVTQGTAVTMILDIDGAGATVAYSGLALITSVKIDLSVKDVAKISYSGTSTGAWAAVV